MQLNTPELMEHIRHVIRQTSKPTWINSVPHNFGDTAAGSLKADEWRTLSTVYLPLALVTFWCYVSDGETITIKRRRQEVLDQTMELVQAVTVIFKRSVTKEDATAYDNHIKKYLQDLHVVHPHAKLLPNMHMATHMSRFLTRFGSVYSWWTFPFERLIGLLQNLPSNNVEGKLSGLYLYISISYGVVS